MTGTIWDLKGKDGDDQSIGANGSSMPGGAHGIDAWCAPLFESDQASTAGQSGQQGGAGENGVDGGLGDPGRALLITVSTFEGGIQFDARGGNGGRGGKGGKGGLGGNGGWGGDGH